MQLNSEVTRPCASLESLKTSLDESTLDASYMQETKSTVSQVSMIRDDMTALVNDITNALDWKQIEKVAQRCDWKRNRDGFAIHASKKQSLYYVLATGMLQCTVKEMRNALTEPTTSDYHGIMSALFGSEFLDGSVLQKEAWTASEQSSYAAEASQMSSQDNAMFKDSDVFLKSAIFAKANIFSRREQWNYLDFIADLDGSNGFIKNLGSVHALNAIQKHVGKSHKYSQLHNVLAGIRVMECEANKQGMPRIRVLFYAQYAKNEEIARTPKSKAASSRLIRHRLHRMAYSMPRFHALMRRRRLGAQILVDIEALQNLNALCTCCSHTFTTSCKSVQCDLCGYTVCAACSTYQQREVYAMQVTKICVCQHCMTRVDACDYDSMTFESLESPRISPSMAGSPSLAVVLADLFESTYNDVSHSKKTSVVAVMKHLLNLEKQETEALGISQALDQNDSWSDPEANNFETLRSQKFAEKGLNDCVLANSIRRSYPLTYENKEDKIPKVLPAKNEKERVQIIEQLNLRELGAVEELDIICSLAAKEMQCEAGFVIVVDGNTQHIIATSDEQFRNLKMPRNQSVCTHLLMDNKPLIVSHLESDVRFYDIDLVKMMKKSFYCGFPVTDKDGIVVATMCCIDQSTRRISESQYLALERLACTTSRILKLKGKN